MMLCRRICSSVNLEVRRQYLSCWRRWASASTTTTTTTTTTTDLEHGETLKPFKEIPGPSGITSLNRIGSLFLFHPFSNYKVEHLHKIFDELHDRYGKMVRMQLGGRAVLVADVEAVTKLFRHDEQFPVRRTLHVFEEYYKRNTEMAPSIAILNGEKWLQVRSAVQTKMTKPTSAMYYLPAQNRVTDDFIEILKRKDYTVEELEMNFFKYAFESIGVVCFNRRLGALDGPSTESGISTTAFVQNIRKLIYIIHQSYSEIPWYRIYPTKFYLEFEKTMKETMKEGIKNIKLARAELERKQKEGTFDPNEPNFLWSLLQEERLSTKQITSVTLDLFNGGTDSTAKNLVWNLYLLAKNPDKQEKLFEEVDRVMGTDNDLTPQHLAKMPYLQAVFKETCRLIFPTSVGASRFLENDISINGYNIPAKTLICTNGRRICLDPDVFERPLEFWPERWLRDEKGKRPREIPTMALIPFGFGVRNCPGRRFAEMEIYLAVAKIVRNLKVKFGPNFVEPEIEYHVFATPTVPIDLEFEQRS